MTNYKLEHLKELCTAVFTGIHILEEKLEVIKYGHNIPPHTVARKIRGKKTYNFRRILEDLKSDVTDLNAGINLRFGHLYESDEDKYFKAFDIELELHKTRADQLRARIFLDRVEPRKFLAKIKGQGMTRPKPKFDQKMRRKATKERTKKITLRHV